MTTNHPNKTYKQLVKDIAFLQWRFAPTQEATLYWENLKKKQS